MHKKSRYIEFCSERKDVPLFLRPEWMDAVCVDTDWHVALAEDKGGDIIGALPYEVKKKWSITAASTPLVTPHSGPWMKKDTAKPLNQQISVHHNTVTQLSTQLSKYTYNYLKLAPSKLPGHAWYWDGYELKTMYTYRLPIDAADTVFKGCKNTIRTDIRNAEKEIEIQTIDSPSEFYDLLKAQVGGHYQLLSKGQIDRLFELQAKHSLFFKKAIQGNQVLGAALFVKTGSDIYYLIGSRQKEGSNLALTALIWDTIGHHAGPGMWFDFEGTMLKKVEPFFRRFGGVPTPYLNVVKMPRWMKWLRG